MEMKIAISAVDADAIRWVWGQIEMILAKFFNNLIVYNLQHL